MAECLRQWIANPHRLVRFQLHPPNSTQGRHMKIIQAHKLVRDKIPDIIVAEGNTPYIRELTEEEFKTALETKLLEEASEVVDASRQTRKETIQELADLQEVMLALMELHGITEEEVGKARYYKAKTNGTFEDRIFLETVEKDIGDIEGQP